MIDEAQDMAADDYRLVQALMKRNEEMRVIAVGDDDQNIFAFRGSDSMYLRSLVTEHGATMYELTDNYRSDSEIVNYANRFVQKIPDRMKCNPITSVSKDSGNVTIFEKAHAFAIDLQLVGSTAVLTETNEQALQVAYMLKQQGKHVRLIQATDGFSFINLTEIRYFFQQIGSGENAAISKERWDNAKRRTEEMYANSRCLDVVRRFFADYESTHTAYYRSDVHEFAVESSIEDFISEEKNTVFVSTIHKAKGREFDNVYILLTNNYEQDMEMMRVIYVGITRARHNLYLYKHAVFANAPITISLSLRDVWLSFFQSFQKQIQNLRSGDKLEYDDGYLCVPNGKRIASLSKSMREQINELGEKGYVVTDAEVSYTLVWHPRDEQHEWVVFLANLTLEKQTKEKKSLTINNI